MSSLLDRLSYRLGGMERTHVYRVWVGELREVAAPREDAVRIELLDAQHIDRLGEIGPYAPDTCADRLARGDACYAAFVGDDLAHYSWVQRAGAHSIAAASTAVPIKPGELWIYNCRTADDHRGKGHYPSMLRRIVQDHFAAGYTCAWIYTSDDNVASQKGILRVGFTPAETLRALRFGRRFVRLGAVSVLIS